MDPPNDAVDVPLTFEMMGLLIGAVDEAESYSVLLARFPQQPMVALIVVASSAERVLVVCPRGSIDQGVPWAPIGEAATAVLSCEDGSSTHGEYFAIDQTQLQRERGGSNRPATEQQFGPWARAWFRRLVAVGF